MDERTVNNRSNKIREATTGRYVVEKIMTYARNGQAMYWASFFLLILIEFVLGGQLSKILTKDNYSLYVNVLNTLPLYNIIVNIGLAYGIAYMTAYNPEIRFRLFRQSLKLQTSWYILLVAVHTALFFVFHNVYMESLLITILISYTYSYRLNINSFFLATRSYNKATLSNILQKVALVIVFIIVHYVDTLRQTLNDRFIIVYPAIEISVVALYLLFFWKTNYDAITSTRTNYRRRILNFSKYSMFNNGLNLLNYTVIAFIIRTGHIAIDLQIILLLCVVFFRYTGVAVAPVFAIMNPLFTTIKNDRPAVKAMYKRYYLITFIVSMFTFIVCRFFFSFIIARFYAQSYQALPAYFNFFAYLVPLSLLNSLNASVMASLGKIKYTFRVEVACTILLGLFFAFAFLFPITDYHVFYYMIGTQLLIKFLLQSYGAYSIVNK